MIIEHEKICELCGVGSLNKIKGMWIESGAIYKVIEVMKKEGWEEPVIICDQNTCFLGDVLLEELDNYEVICLDPDGLAADERSVSLAHDKIPETADCMIALGSVTIHDITRYLCWEYGLPFISVPTAASGEGYMTPVSAVIRKGVKKNVRAKAPAYFCADTDIFSSAPTRLTLAGFSDLIGRYIALADWKVSSLLRDYELNQVFCEMIETSMKTVMDQMELLTTGDPAACEQLLYALILPDIVMGVNKNAMPLMGAEHHISRYMDISVDEPKLEAVHGEKVGVATLLCLKSYAKFKKALEEDRLVPRDVFGLAEKEIQKGFWEKGVREAVAKINDPDPLDEITGEMVLDHKEEILKILNALPSAEWIEDACQKLGCRTMVEELGIDDEMIQFAMKYSPYVASDITILKLQKLFEKYD